MKMFSEILIHDARTAQAAVRFLNVEVSTIQHSGSCVICGTAFEDGGDARTDRAGKVLACAEYAEYDCLKEKFGARAANSLTYL
jgi:hypothetical protein